MNDFDSLFIKEELISGSSALLHDISANVFYSKF